MAIDLSVLDEDQRVAELVRDSGAHLLLTGMGGDGASGDGQATPGDVADLPAPHRLAERGW